MAAKEDKIRRRRCKQISFLRSVNSSSARQADAENKAEANRAASTWPQAAGLYKGYIGAKQIHRFHRPCGMLAGAQRWIPMSLPS